jgi:hypothetical protein
MEALWTTSGAFAPNDCMSAAVGKLRIWIMRHKLNWSVCSEELPVASIEPLHSASPPSNPTWQRFVAPQEMDRVRLAPVLPERSLIMRPGVPIKIVPGHTAHLFVTLPVGVRIEINGGGKAANLCELPSQTLSKSWFGVGASEGEICYALKTRARQSIEELTDTHQGRAICPVQLRNDSHDPLPFTRLCLRTRHMALYGTPDGRLWTNLTTVTHKDSTTPEQVAFADGPPKQANNTVLLCPPREAVTHLFAKHALGGLLSLTNIFH